jgi:hypothetical protein
MEQLVVGPTVGVLVVAMELVCVETLTGVSAMKLKLL